MTVVSGEWCETCQSVEPVVYRTLVNFCDTCGEETELTESEDE